MVGGEDVAQRIVNEAAVRRAAADSVKASAKLEGRVVKPGYQRSAVAAKYIASRVARSPK